MVHMKGIPTQKENPNGLHQRYYVEKLAPHPRRADREYMERYGVPEFIRVKTDPGSEYFVMRLDEGGKDREHIRACRIGIHAYAKAIEHHIPELAKDLRERYPLLP